MLLGNYSVLNKSPAHFLGGPAPADTPAATVRGGAVRNVSWGDSNGGFSLAAGTPNGYRPPGCWGIPQTEGSMGSNTLIRGEGEVTHANLAGLIRRSASVEGSGSLASVVRAAARATASLQGSGSFTGFSQGLLTLIAAVTGLGGLTSGIRGRIQAEASLQGSSDLTSDAKIISLIQALLQGVGALDASPTLIARMAASSHGAGGITVYCRGKWAMQGTLQGSGHAVGSVQGKAHMQALPAGTGGLVAASHALGRISASISTFTELSPTNLAAAVWNAVAAQFVAEGTMGRALVFSGGGGGGGDPAVIAAAVWHALETTNVPAGSMGAILKELHLLMGLDPAAPLVTTDTTRRVPADGSLISQTLTDDGEAITVRRT